jgi:SEC-C motif domain protein
VFGRGDSTSISTADVCAISLNMIDPQQCPCGSGVPYAQCCQALLLGQRRAATAEALMRSRYSAYVMGDISYVLKTWHSSTRPPGIDPETTPNWCSLEIIHTERGQVGDDEGIVEFSAKALSQKKTFELHETSRFVKEDGQWLYVSGEVGGDSQVTGRETDKVGRNSPCPCGSGRKFKKCCGR